MSNRSNSQENGNFWSKLWTSGADDRVKEIQHINDPGTIADEVLHRTRDILIPLSLLFSFAFCAFFYFSFLSDNYPIWVAIIGAGIISLIIENGKIYYGIRSVRMMYGEKWWIATHDILVFLGVFAFTALTFYWSFKNSTSGLHDLTTRIGTEKSIKEISFRPNTAEIDKQIAAARQTQEKAGGMRWKGKITVEGQRAIRKSEESITKLQAQRLAMIEQAQQQYNRQTTLADNNTQTAAGWTAIFGGFIEVCQIVLIIIAGSCEKKLLDRQANALPHHRTQSQTTHPQTLTFSSPIGFNVDPDGNVRGTYPQNPPPPVNGLPKTPPETLYYNVPQTNTENATIGSDEVLKYYKSKLQQDVANLKNENGRASTIASRMHSNLIAYSRRQRQNGFFPDAILATEMYIFLEQAFKTLDDYGRPYEFSKGVLNDLRPYIDEKEYTTRKAEQKPQA